MKRYFLFLAVITFLFASCNPEEPQHSPEISNSHFVAYHPDSLHTIDTLKIRLVDNEYYIDTIAVGDTVRYGLLLNAVYNQLTSFTIKTDTNYLALSLILSSDYDTALDASSDVANGSLVFKPGYNGATLRVQYIAKKSGTPKVSMTLATTSKFSPTEVAFRQVIE